MCVVVESNKLSRLNLFPNRLFAVFLLGCRYKRLFCFSTSVLHTTVRPQPGCVEEKGYTVCHWLGGSSRIIRATGRIVKSGAHRKCGGMTIPSGGETLFLSTPVSGVGGSLGEKIHRGLF